jgi:hypothetical protein
MLGPCRVVSTGRESGAADVPLLDISCDRGSRVGGVGCALLQNRSSCEK